MTDFTSRLESLSRLGRCSSAIPLHYPEPCDCWRMSDCRLGILLRDRFFGVVDLAPDKNETRAQAVDFVRERLQRGESPRAVCAALCDQCLAPNTEGCGKGCGVRSNPS